MEEQNRVLTGPVYQQILFFFFPILLGTFFQQLYNTADAIIVGQVLGTKALAAVGGTTGVLANFVVNLFVGIASGTTVVVAQHFGAGNYHGLRRTIHTSMALAFLGGAALTVLGIALAHGTLSVLGTPDDVISLAALYLRVYFLGVIPSFVYNVGSGILRAVGDTKRPLYFLIIACLVNIVLDIVFVAVLHMGVAGAALATILSQFASAALTLRVLTHTTRVYRYIPADTRIDKNTMRSVLNVGIPAGLQSNLYTVSNMLIQSVVNSFGTSVIAAWTAYGKIDSFFWMITAAYGVAVTTFTGQNYGARRMDRVRAGVRVTMVMEVITALAVGALFYTFAPQLLAIFSRDAEVIEVGVTMARFLPLFYVTYVTVEVLAGTVRGCGDAVMPTVLVAFGICVLRVAWVLAFVPTHRTMVMLFVSYPISWSLTSILFVFYYRRFQKKQAERERARAAAAAAAAQTEPSAPAAGTEKEETV